MPRPPDLLERLRQAQDLIPFGIAILDAVRDGGGRLVDFIVVHRNAAADRIAPLPHGYSGKRLSELRPFAMDPGGVFHDYARVCETGLPTLMDLAFPEAAGIGARVFALDVRKLGDGIIATYEDVTDRLRTAREQRTLLGVAEVLQSRAPHETIEQLARVAVPDHGDFCFVDVVDGPDVIDRVAVGFADPADEPIARRLKRRFPRRQFPGGAVNRAIRAREAVVLSQLDDDYLQKAARDAHHLETLREMTLRSSLTVPLWSRDETFGALTLVSKTRVYDARDIAFGQELARRASTALLNARLYQQAESARRRAEEASGLKDEFLATVSHELRTPLAAIVGWAAILDGKLSNPEILQKGLAVIRRNANAQTQIIDDILDVSRIITGKLRIAPRPLDVGELCVQALDAVRPAASARGIELTLARPDAPLTMFGDPDRLRQVVWNLLSNAVKFSEKGSPVVLAVASEGGDIIIVVKDSGRGIAPDFLPHVFDRFRQADSSSTRSRGGLGLGLAIVRHIVDLHGGTVVAESEGDGKGARFVVTLPVAALAPPGSDRVTSAITPGSWSSDNTSLEGVRVLVVDDDPDARELVEWVLDARGAKVVKAASADEAMQCLESQTFDVLVSDIGMPVEDGLSMMRRIRAAEGASFAGIPAAALSAFARREDEDAARDAGYQSYVAKPADPAMLVRKVRELADLAR